MFLHRENDKTVGRIDKETQQKLLLEMGFAREVADRVIFMADGIIVEDGTPFAASVKCGNRHGIEGDMQWYIAFFCNFALARISIAVVWTQ